MYNRSEILGNKKSRPFMWKIHKQTAHGIVPYLAGTLLTFFYLRAAMKLLAILVDQFIHAVGVSALPDQVILEFHKVYVTSTSEMLTTQQAFFFIRQIHAGFLCKHGAILLEFVWDYVWNYIIY